MTMLDSTSCAVKMHRGVVEKGQLRGHHLGGGDQRQVPVRGLAEWPGYRCWGSQRGTKRRKRQKQKQQRRRTECG